jgi:hypothetical protein
MTVQSAVDRIAIPTADERWLGSDMTGGMPGAENATQSIDDLEDMSLKSMNSDVVHCLPKLRQKTDQPDCHTNSNNEISGARRIRATSFKSFLSNKAVETVLLTSILASNFEVVPACSPRVNNVVSQRAVHFL